MLKQKKSYLYQLMQKKHWKNATGIHDKSPHGILFDQETNSQQMKSDNELMLMGFTSFTMFLIMLKQQVCYIVNGVLKTEHQLGGNAFQDTVYALNQCPIYGAISLIARVYVDPGIIIRVKNGTGLAH